MNLVVLMPKMKADRKKSIIGFVLIMIVPFIVLGILQQLGGHTNPFYIISREFEVFKTIGWLFILVYMTTLFYFNNFVKDFKWSLYDSEDPIYIGKQNVFVNLTLVVPVVLIIGPLLFNVYAKFEPTFNQLFQSI
ncbi:MAG: hypothetical protein JEZ08_22325 [Clostridiales bacterium]|nr:hypothetical protein [Clostridiales bacterium]